MGKSGAPGGGGGKSAVPQGMGGGMPGGLAQFLQMAQQGGMGPMGGMPMEQGGGMFGGKMPMGSVQDQNMRSAMMRAQMGQQGMGNDMGGGRQFTAPWDMGGGKSGAPGGMTNPLEYAMMMQRQRGMGGGMGGGMARPGGPIQNPGLVAQQKAAAAKVAQEQAAQQAKIKSDALKKQQDEALRKWKNQNPLMRANQSYNDYMMEQQAGGGGGA